MLRNGLRVLPRAALTPALNKLNQITQAVRWALRFNGVNTFARLQNRAINIEGDNTFEFWSPPDTNRVSVIISQNITGTFSAREFQLTSNAGNNGLSVNMGGSSTIIFTAVQGYKASTRYGLTLIGTTAQVFEGGLEGSLVRTATFARGVAREPTAITKIGCNTDGAANVNFFQGPQRDIRINGVLWRIADRNQTIQLPSPSGLGSNVLNINAINFESGSALNSFVSGAEFGFNAVDTWGQRAFRVPITIVPSMHYLLDVEVISGYSEGELCRLTLNDKLGDGAPHVRPVTIESVGSVPFETSSAYYGSFRDFGRVANGRLRCIFMIPNATSLNWFIGIRLQSNQNGRSIRLRNFTVRPLWSLNANELSSNRPAGNFINSSATVVASGGTSELTTADVPVQPFTLYQVLAIGGSSDRSRWQWRRSSDQTWQFGANNLEYGTAESPASALFRTPAGCDAVRIYYRSAAATATALSIRRIDSLCNPLVLNNVVPEQWEQIPA